MLLVFERLTDSLLARVLTPGRVVGSPGVHLPDERVRLASPTDEDLVLLATLVPAGVDAVAVSFVRRAVDLMRVRRPSPTSCRRGTSPLLVAKIETRSAVDHLDEVLEAADAVMVARGDLGTSCPIEEVPHLQKKIVRRCVEWGQPVITATQMLESMIHSPMPTRAEASDVANAVFDGTDAVMLSGETAIGRHPRWWCAPWPGSSSRAEREADYAAWGARLGRLQRRGAVGRAGGDHRCHHPCGLVHRHRAGRRRDPVLHTLRAHSTGDGPVPAAVPAARPVAERGDRSPAGAVVGRRADHREPVRDTDEMVWFAVEAAVASGYVVQGNIAVVVAGAPEDESPTSDVVRVVRVR